MTNHYLGVDVSRRWIDTFCPQSGQSQRLMMEAPELDAFAAKLADQDIVVVLEATGGCEQPLLHPLCRHHVGYARVNPRQAREFARATGVLAKTDAVDARVLANMGQILGLKADNPIDLNRARLSELVARREALCGYITKERQRLQTTSDLFIKEDIDASIAFLNTRARFDPIGSKLRSKSKLEQQHIRSI
jgi:transposase